MDSKDMEVRISTLEKNDIDKEHRLRALEVGQVVNTERYKSIDIRLNKIDSHTAWVIRLLFGAIALALINWVIGGGLVTITGG